jgi:hypothetical protein
MRPLVTSAITSRSRGIRYKPSSHFRVRFLFAAALSIAFDRPAYRLEYFLVAKRFGEKVDCPGLHSLDGHMNIAVTGYVDDGVLMLER